MLKRLPLLVCALWLFTSTIPIAQAQANDPVTQCARGVELFFEDNQTEAYPLLEAGFNGRATATFTDPNDLGICALALGILRNNSDDKEASLVA